MKWVGEQTKLHALGQVKKRVSRAQSSEKVGGLVDIYLAEKQAKGLEEYGVKQAVTCMRSFARTFGSSEPRDVTAQEIEAWLDGLNKATRTVFNHYSNARQFFNWRGVRQLCPITPFLDVDAPSKTDRDARKTILTPAQMAELLTMPLEPWVKCKIVLGGFAGLRTCEMARMSYDCIDPEYEEINVNKNQSKGGEAMRPRSITLQDPVKRHLPEGTGPLFAEVPTWRQRRLGRGRTKSTSMTGEILIPSNALRHSFASYHLAHFRDAAKTAFEMGHVSPKQIYESYANAVSRRDAAAWWSL